MNNDVELWHQILGHISYNQLANIIFKWRLRKNKKKAYVHEKNLPTKIKKEWI
jgi:hypothetical protein